jgi:branched-chain amino acid transport system permease protein
MTETLFSPALLLIQTLNGIQFGMMLFLFAAGLTLVLGIMNLLNMAHGSFFMLGAYFAATLQSWTGSVALGIVLAIPATFVAGIAIELLVVRALYARGPLEQVLATIGLILFINEAVRMIWGAVPLHMSAPAIFTGSVMLPGGIAYPLYRLVLIVLGALVSLFLYVLVAKTRLGMLIRAGASNREMVEAIGIDISRLFTVVFGIGAFLAGLAGMAMGPILSVDANMGDLTLILAQVVIVIGGIGSIRGSLIAALSIGIVDSMGRAFLPGVLQTYLPASIASAVGPAVTSILIYIFMVLVLIFRPQGLFPAARG